MTRSSLNATATRLYSLIDDHLLSPEISVVSVVHQLAHDTAGAVAKRRYEVVDSCIRGTVVEKGALPSGPVTHVLDCCQSELMINRQYDLVCGAIARDDALQLPVGNVKHDNSSGDMINEVTHITTVAEADCS